jgi:hypothetical protein
MSLPAPVPVKVNFNVVVDADSKALLFGEPIPTPTNVIVATLALPSSALYDPDTNKGLIELWEPADAQGDIKCQLANSDTSSSGGPNLTGAYQVAAKKLATGLEALLCDSFDCSGAVPFNNYAANIEYYKQRDFGRVALGMMAHYLFGHVDATAAITNDKAFVQSMLSVSAAGDDDTADGAANRAAAFTKSTAGNVETWNFTASNADANLAFRLVKAIIEKGKAGNDVTSTTLTQSLVSAITSTATDQTLANIVKQVIGQDSSRTQNVDGSARTREQHLLLRFYIGDVIYINITVKKPTIQVTGYSAGANPPANTLVSEQSYTLKITLGSGVPIADPSKLIYQAGSNNTIVTGYTGTLRGELTIPEGVTTIGAWAFNGASQLTKVILPSTLTTIGEAAFRSTGITSITLGANITTLGNFAFNGSLLKTADLSAMPITSLGQGMFMDCRSLVTLKLPTGLTSIGFQAIRLCTVLANLQNISNVTYVGPGGFQHCNAITSLNFPKLTTIAEYAFNDCSSLSSFTAPLVTSVGGNAFSGTQVTPVFPLMA